MKKAKNWRRWGEVVQPIPGISIFVQHDCSGFIDNIIVVMMQPWTETD